jgi:hypothetical protein
MPRKCLMRLKKRSTRFRCRYRRTQSAACGWSATGCWSRHSCGRRLREWRCCRSLCRRAESRPQAELPAGPRSRGRAGSEGRPCPAREVANSEGAQASGLVAAKDHRGESCRPSPTPFFALSAKACAKALKERGVRTLSGSVPIYRARHPGVVTLQRSAGLKPMLFFRS